MDDTSLKACHQILAICRGSRPIIEVYFLFSACHRFSATALLMSASPTATSLTGLVQGNNAKTQAAAALSHADNISDPQLGYGRLDTYQAVQTWRKAMGLK
jgi:hypothetical protein